MAFWMLFVKYVLCFVERWASGLSQGFLEVICYKCIVGSNPTLSAIFVDRFPHHFLNGEGILKKDQRILLRSFFSARNLLPVNEKTRLKAG